MTLEKLHARLTRLIEEKKQRGLPTDGEVFIRVQTPYYNRTKSKFYTFLYVESGLSLANGQASIATISINLEKDEVKS